MTTNGVWTQRKNAAIKLQHSGLATVAVYHIRHRVVHHIDMGSPAVDLIPPRNVEHGAGGFVSALERWPDFAERGCAESSEQARATWVTQRFVILC